jgi:SAM-dependent methyltransferase
MAKPEQGRVADSFDSHVESYSDQINRAIAFSGLEHDFFIRAKRDRLLELVERHVGSPLHLAALDLGCGVGAYHSLLIDSFASLAGVDVSEQSIEFARGRNPRVAYAAYDGERLPYVDSGFDVVFAICVLHHVPVPAWPGFVTELRRVLKPGGLAVVFEHNPLNPATRYIVRSCPIDSDAVLLRAEHTARLLRDAGLQVVEARTILSVPPKGALLRRLDGLLGRLPFGAQYYTAARKA